MPTIPSKAARIGDANAPEARRLYGAHSATRTDRIAHALEHMPANRAVRTALQQLPAHATASDRDAVVEQARERFAAYRAAWREQPRRVYEERIHGVEALRQAEIRPLCVDVELAALCDLACPFCYRQTVMTPDTLMETEFARRVIREAAAMGVPSIKFNWRGEPLLHPELPALVAFAKDLGVLDAIINTNAVTLTRDKARALVEAGLDFVIFSFDGACDATYQAMRPGRFKANAFEQVVANIRGLAEVKQELGSPFPFTKIQMILTRETTAEQERFLELFTGVVDDVSLKTYTERGGSLEELDTETRQRVAAALRAQGLPEETPFMRYLDGEIYVATGRLPCEQPLQRLSVAYDGRVSMCCYDWGLAHPVGALNDYAARCGQADLNRVATRIAQGARGYEAMAHAAPPPSRYDLPVERDLESIWTGTRIETVRRHHAEGKVDAIPVCKTCPFKETYAWRLIEEAAP